MFFDTGLKPCPFCGAIDLEEWLKDTSKNKCELLKIRGVWKVVCCGCGVETANYDKPEQAIKAWNRRSSE